MGIKVEELWCLETRSPALVGGIVSIKCSPQVGTSVCR